MIKNAARAAGNVMPLDLDIGRAYPAKETAGFLGITVFVLNQRVRQGLIKPVFPDGDRRYSGFVIAKLLGWTLSEDPRDYLPGGNPVKDFGIGG